MAAKFELQRDMADSRIIFGHIPNYIANCTSDLLYLVQLNSLSFCGLKEEKETKTEKFEIKIYIR